MLELLINGEIRVSTILKLLSQYWDVLTLILIVGCGVIAKAYKRLSA
ncbi:hypothetical protein DFP78_11369 [Photobacterium lutimaris]|nr:hypothetical protein DFP78_11369 [Photobacterium lutimaris]